MDNTTLASTAVCREVARFYADARHVNPEAAEQALQRLGVQTRGFGPVTHWLVLAAAPSTVDALNTVNVLRQIIDRATRSAAPTERALGLDDLGELLRRHNAA